MVVILSLAVFSAAPGAAQTLELPFSARPPRVVGVSVEVAVVALADERAARFEARRAGARSLARSRALAALHTWADDALAEVVATPLVARAVHAAIDREAEERARRPLVDGGVVLVLRVPLAALRTAAPGPGLPWSAP